MAVGRFRRVLVACIAAAACRSHDPDPPSAAPAASPPAVTPPRADAAPPPRLELDQKVLVEHLADAHGVVVEGDDVYFADGQQHLRVPRRGGPVEPAPDWPGEALHGRLGEGATLYAGGVFFELRGDGIYREPQKPRHAPWTQIARSFPSDDRKAVVIDGDRVYWIEPAAAAVLSVAKTGGPVSFVCEAPVAVFDDLAVHGDTLYLLGIEGALDMVDKHGGPMRLAGIVHLGDTERGVWMTAGDDALYIVSDAIGMFSNARAGGMVSRVAYPQDGELLDDRDDGLLFPANSVELRDTHREFAAIGDEVRSGRVAVTIKVIAETDEQAHREAAPQEAQLRTDLGPDARIEVVIVRPPPGTTRTPPWSSVGITKEHALALFAPPAKP